MPATKDQMGRTVSMDYGQKGQFMSALQGPGSGGAQGGGPAPAAPPAGVAPSPTDPLGMLLGGALGPGPGDPVTAGLSVGPGGGPTTAPAVTDDVVERLRLVAQNAKTPMLRSMARAALLRRVKSNGAW